MTKEAIEPIETGLSQYTYTKFALINETIDQSLVSDDHQINDGWTLTGLPDWYNPWIALTQTVLDMKDNDGQSLACWSAVVLFHEYIHELMYIDRYTEDPTHLSY